MTCFSLNLFELSRLPHLKSPAHMEAPIRRVCKTWIRSFSEGTLWASSWPCSQILVVQFSYDWRGPEEFKTGGSRGAHLFGAPEINLSLWVEFAFFFVCSLWSEVLIVGFFRPTSPRAITSTSSLGQLISNGLVTIPECTTPKAPSTCISIRCFVFHRSCLCSLVLMVCIGTLAPEM